MDLYLRWNLNCQNFSQHGKIVDTRHFTIYKTRYWGNILQLRIQNIIWIFPPERATSWIVGNSIQLYFHSRTICLRQNKRKREGRLACLAFTKASQGQSVDDSTTNRWQKVFRNIYIIYGQYENSIENGEFTVKALEFLQVEWPWLLFASHV